MAAPLRRVLALATKPGLASISLQLVRLPELVQVQRGQMPLS